MTPPKLHINKEIFWSGTSVNDPNVNISTSLPIDNDAAYLIMTRHIVEREGGVGHEATRLLPRDQALSK
jgi:hypothetical protein